MSYLHVCVAGECRLCSSSTGWGIRGGSKLRPVWFKLKCAFANAMVKDLRQCHGRKCLGPRWAPRTKCARRRDGSGKACTLNKACEKCGEWRCRAHCKCAEQGGLSGRQAARTKSAPSTQSTRAPSTDNVLPSRMCRRRMSSLLQQHRLGYAWWSVQNSGLFGSSSSVHFRIPW